MMRMPSLSLSSFSLTIDPTTARAGARKANTWGGALELSAEHRHQWGVRSVLPNSALCEFSNHNVREQKSGGEWASQCTAVIIKLTCMPKSQENSKGLML